jgi:hypothetical protein
MDHHCPIESLRNWNKKELEDFCRNKWVVGYSNKKKTEIIEIIMKSCKGRYTNSGQCIMESSSSTEPILQDPPSSFSNTITLSVNHENDLLALLHELIEKYGMNHIHQQLNLASGTITRWIELKDVPKNYEFDLLKLANIKIDYKNYSSKQKDQFFTPVATATYCYNVFCNVLESFQESIDSFHFIEPSAGDGSFLAVLPSEKTIAMDIEPRHPSIIEQDYLEWKPTDSDKKYVCFGNPPFGLRGHQALKFINHSYAFAEYVCFILPQLFESDGKGVPRKRVKGYHLVHSEKLDSYFYEPNKTEVKINTIFQIWSKNHHKKEYEIQDYSNEKMRIYSMSDGGTISTTRNKNMIGKCDIYIPSTCFGKENMKCYREFADLPGKKGYGIVFHENKIDQLAKMMQIDWSEIAFLSTNSAYNLRSSQIYSLF